jgi:uncharacterized protein YkwD
MNPPTHSSTTRHVASCLVVLAAVVLLVHGSAQADTSAARQPKPRPVVNAADLAKQIHAQINQERARHGLAALARDARLARIAAKHSRDMAKRDYLAHDSPEGHGFADRYQQGGYTCQVRVGNEIHLGAENIALARLYESVRTVNGVAHYDWNSMEQIARKTVDGWMNSSRHRRNILRPYWRREGVGVEIHPDNRVYITQNFC